MLDLINKIINHDLFQYVMLAARIITPVMALFVVWRSYTSFKKSLRHYDPVLMLTDPVTGAAFPILYWENSIGRAKTCDIVIPDMMVSRDHAVLLRRDEGWFIVDTGSKGGILVNDEPVEGRRLIGIGDIITIGATRLILEKTDGITTQRRKLFRGFRKQAASPFFLMFVTMLVQISMTVQLMFGTGEILMDPLTPFIGLLAVDWIFFFFSTKILHRISFELETVGLLLSSIGILLLTGEGDSMTQLVSMIIGIVIFSLLIIFLENTDFVAKYRYILGGFAILLFLANIVLGTEVNGSKNWIYIGSLSFQPSEFIKVIFVIVGASTLDRLQTKKNLTEFIAFAGVCLGFLFYMRDFGSACIFFAGFLVIAFMRSGSIRTIALILAVAVLGVIMIISFKPYVAERFAGWMHVWDHINDSLGYQQTRALTYIASGDLFGMGLGRGYLHFIAAGDSDLVFGMLSEEQGLLMSFTVLFALALLIMYTRADVARSRSTFYSICSSAAAGILLFQTCLNVFGTTDILPLTGVTLPFISAGGSSMISVWGMLALIKASDERTYAARRANHRERKEFKREELEERRAAAKARYGVDEDTAEIYVPKVDHEGMRAVRNQYEDAYDRRDPGRRFKDKYGASPKPAVSRNRRTAAPYYDKNDYVSPAADDYDEYTGYDENFEDDYSDYEDEYSDTNRAAEDDDIRRGITQKMNYRNIEEDIFSVRRDDDK